MTQAKPTAMLYAFLVTSVLAVHLQAAEPGNNAADRKLVLAHMMAGCTAACAWPEEEYVANWPAKPTVEGASHWKRRVGGVLPEMEKYRLDPLGAARADIQLGKKAGVDAFGMFHSGYIVNSQFARQTESYWQAAREDGEFKLYPEIWTLATEDRIGRTTEEMALIREQYDEAWLRIDGKRVVFYAYQHGKAPLPEGVSPGEAFERIFAPLGGRDEVYFCLLSAAGPVPGYASPPPPSKEWLDLADALNFFWSLSYGDDLTVMPAMDVLAETLNKELWMRAVPSFFQHRLGRKVGGRLHERLGMAAYYDNWMRIISRQPRVAYVTTWNDHTEDSGIADINHGHAYVELTRFFAAWYKTGKRPPVENEQVLLFHHPQLTEQPMLLPPGCKPAGRYNWNATPPTDYLAVVAMLEEPAQVRIDLSAAGRYETIATLRFPAGVNFWLAYHPLADADDSAIRNMDPNTPEPKFAPVYPEERPDFFITELTSALKDRDVYLVVSRDGDVTHSFRSRSSIAGTAAKANLCTIGNVFVLGE